MNNERPRKVYELTNEGQSTLDFTQDSLELIRRKIGTHRRSEIGFETEEMNQSSPHHINPYPTHMRERRMFT